MKKKSVDGNSRGGYKKALATWKLTEMQNAFADMRLNHLESKLSKNHEKTD